MPQYGMIVYSPVPADPGALSAEYLAALDAYPERAKALKGKVLGGTYFSAQRGFALESSTEAVAVGDRDAHRGTLVDADLVVSAFYVVTAPDIDAAVEIAKLHPAARDGGIEVRRLFVPADPARGE